MTPAAGFDIVQTTFETKRVMKLIGLPLDEDGEHNHSQMIEKLVALVMKEINTFENREALKWAKQPLESPEYREATRHARDVNKQYVLSRVISRPDVTDIFMAAFSAYVHERRRPAMEIFDAIATGILYPYLSSYYDTLCKSGTEGSAKLRKIQMQKRHNQIKENLQDQHRGIQELITMMLAPYTEDQVDEVGQLATAAAMMDVVDKSEGFKVKMEPTVTAVNVNLEPTVNVNIAPTVNVATAVKSEPIEVKSEPTEPTDTEKTDGEPPQKGKKRRKN